MTDKEVTHLLEETAVVTVDDVIDASKLVLSEHVVQLNRVAKVVKGGRRFSFNALVVVGDNNGHVGIGFGKANEVPEAIQKAVQNGKRNLVYVSRVGRTIPYGVTGEFGAARVLLRPASEGTGIIAGPSVRPILELAGIKDVLTKNLGTNNAINILKATLDALNRLRDGEEVARLRGRNLEDLVGVRRANLLREYSRSARSAAVKSEEQARTPEGRPGPVPSERQLVVVASDDGGQAVAPEAGEPAGGPGDVAPVAGDWEPESGS